MDSPWLALETSCPCLLCEAVRERRALLAAAYRLEAVTVDKGEAWAAIRLGKMALRLAITAAIEWHRQE